MARRNPIWLITISAVLALSHAHSALAFGPLAHRIAGLLAEPELCAAARSELAALGGDSLADAGMWADTGLSAPAMLREVPPEKLVRGVLAVIRGAQEVLVTSGPVRPLLALRELVPGLDAAVLRRMGVMRALEARAETILKKRAGD